MDFIVPTKAHITLLGQRRSTHGRSSEGLHPHRYPRHGKVFCVFVVRIAWEDLICPDKVEWTSKIRPSSLRALYTSCKDIPYFYLVLTPHGSEDRPTDYWCRHRGWISTSVPSVSQIFCLATGSSFSNLLFQHVGAQSILSHQAQQGQNRLNPCP